MDLLTFLKIVLEEFERFGQSFLADNIVTAISLLISLLLSIGIYLWRESEDGELEWAGILIISTCFLFGVGIAVGLVFLFYLVTGILMILGFATSLCAGGFVLKDFYAEYLDEYL